MVVHMRLASTVDELTAAQIVHTVYMSFGSGKRGVGASSWEDSVRKGMNELTIDTCNTLRNAQATWRKLEKHYLVLLGKGGYLGSPQDDACELHDVV